MDLKEQNEKLQDILGRLVALKNYKDRHGKDETYLKEQPLLWKIARETLYACVGTSDTDTASDCNIPHASGSGLPDGFKVYKCTDCGATNVKRDNGEVRVGFCDECEHSLWN